MKKRLAGFLSVILLFHVLFTAPAIAEIPMFYTLEEVEAYIRECAEQRSSFFIMQLINDEVYHTDESELRGELVDSAPYIRSALFSIKRQGSGKMRIAVFPTYFSGVRMADAWRTGNLDRLSEEEKKVLEQAVALVDRLKAQCDSPLAMEKAIYKELCARLTYFNAPSDRLDILEPNALTALTKGYVNCQGYADAFYLLATLAGFQVGFQSGVMEDNGEGHIWNTICLDSQWYVVDVTTGDTSCSDDMNDCSYYLFNAGLDVAQNILSWPERWETAEIAPHSDKHYYFLASEDGFGYTCKTLYSAARLAYNKRLSKRQEGIWMMVPSVSEDVSIDTFQDILSKLGPHATSWCTYYQTYGNDLYLYVQWDS